MITSLDELKFKERYYTDGVNIFRTPEDYCKHIEDCYEGIKDELESWLDIQVEENLEEKTGKEILEIMLDRVKKILKKIERKLEDGRN